MNVKPHSINPVATGLQRKPFSLIVIAGLFSIGGLALIQESNVAESNAIAQTVNIAPAEFSIQALSITGASTGTAVINLDDFIPRFNPYSCRTRVIHYFTIRRKNQTPYCCNIIFYFYITLCNIGSHFLVQSW